MVICVDIGGSSTKVGLVDETGQPHAVESIPTGTGADQFFESLAALITRISKTAEASNHICVGIGVAVAGFLNEEKDRLLYNSNLHWLEGFALRDRLAKTFNMPVELETDSNSASMAEYQFGCGQESKRFLCATVGTGLGVGFIVDGKPLRFAYGCLGDMGHIIVQHDGPLCSCGGRGCAEVFVSAPMLASQFSRQAGLSGDVSLRTVIEASQVGHPVAIQILEDAGKWLGVAIASMANILFPDQIAIAGGLSAGGDPVMHTAERVFRESAGVLAQSGVKFTRARLGPSATLIGAAWPLLGGEILQWLSQHAINRDAKSR